jgi:hypothetical protein
MAHTKRLWVELAIEFAAFALLVTSVVSLWQHNLVLTAVVLVECGIALWRWHTRYDVSFFLIIALLGSMAEAVFVRFGVWHYANPTLLGMPLWFPTAFGTTGLIGIQLARTVTEIWDRVNPPPDRGDVASPPNARPRCDTTHSPTCSP